MKKYLLTLQFVSIFFFAGNAQVPLLFGLTNEGGAQLLGNIFQTNSSGSAFKNDYSFYVQTSEPESNVIQANDGLLYGTLSGAGVTNDGSIYSFNINTATETLLHNFGTGTDGANPQSPLCQATDNLLYGTTYEGGVKAPFSATTLPQVLKPICTILATPTMATTLSALFSSLITDCFMA
jgi:uncharacterized repeat protein (TIGR03803 family)